MLLTMPVFFAFYAMLTVAIELRGAPFFGWIHDLSRPDPLYIIPVLMGLTQIWQMRITPQTGTDPAQQKMMMIMPVVFMFFFLWTSAGALLYWLVSNVWGIGQQYLTNYLIGPPTVRTVQASGRAPDETRWLGQDRCCSARGVKMPDAIQPVVDFLTRFVTALGVRTPVDVEETADGLRLNLSGEEAELLVRHRGEPLKALQHIVDMALRSKPRGGQARVRGRSGLP